MIAPPAWLLAVPLVLATPAQAARLLPGPMPQLTAPSEPAPVPDRTIVPPPADDAIPGTRLVPALTNRLSDSEPAGDGYAPGSAFSPELERRHGDSGTKIGNILAPGLQLRVPLR